jgi:hypothetical protein
MTFGTRGVAVAPMADAAGRLARGRRQRRLAEQLEIRLRERNVRVLAAGYAPVHQEAKLDGAELAPACAALEYFRRAHEPHPALILERHYTIVAANVAFDPLVRGVEPEPIAPPNGAHLLHRLRRRAHLAAVPELERLHAELAAYPSGELQPSTTAAEILLPPRLRAGGEELVFVSTVSSFETVVDIALEEFCVAALYLADEATTKRLLCKVPADRREQ